MANITAADVKKLRELTGAGMMDCKKALTEAKVPFVIMNAGTAHITQMAPQYVRTSFSMWHAGYALGEVGCWPS
jgi:hypothetical protein